MPRAKKPAGTAVDRRNGQRADLSAPSPERVPQFDAPEGVCDAARDAWDEFWADRPALLLTRSSRVVLLRWVDALDRYLRTTAEADEEPLVRGSTGQPTDNPLYKVAERALATVERCEKQLGIGGLNAASLGLAAINERRSLADMNARYDKRDDDSPSEAAVDPRLRVVTGQVVTREA